MYKGIKKCKLLYLLLALVMILSISVAALGTEGEIDGQEYEEAPAAEYTLLINYVDEEGEALTDPYINENMSDGHEYNVVSPIIEGYTADQETVLGIIAEDDVAVNVVYSAEVYEEDIVTVEESAEEMFSIMAVNEFTTDTGVYDLIGQSTNDHTNAKYLWDYDGYIYVAIVSSLQQHQFIGFQINGEPVPDEDITWLTGSVNLIVKDDQGNTIINEPPVGKSGVAYNWVVGKIYVDEIPPLITIDLNGPGGFKLTNVIYELRGALNVYNEYPPAPAEYDVDQSEPVKFGGLPAGTYEIEAKELSDYKYESVTITVGNAVPVTVNAGDTDSISFAQGSITIEDDGDVSVVLTANYDGTIDIHYLYYKINTVTFNKNHADASGYTEAIPQTKTVAYGQTVDALPIPPTRTGYTLHSWNTQADGNGTTFTASTVVTDDITVYAQWSANAYTVTFDAQGGTAPNPASKSVTFGEAYGSLATTSRSGYTFMGWYTAAVGGSEVTAATIVSNASNHTLYARWSANAYTVTFDANGGLTAVPPSKSVTFGEAYGTLATTSRSGYTFMGWYTAAVGGTEVTAVTTVTTAGNHTLYARWSANTITVTFDANGGTTAVPASKSVTFGAAYGTLATTSRSGYTFTGWYTAAVGGTEVTAATIVSNASNHTLYARWSANAYTVTFDAQGGTAPNPPSKSVTFGEAYGALATTSRTGYTFTGWYTAAVGGSEVTAATIVSNASNHTLYARWSANAYTVTFDAQGGAASNPASKSVTFGEAYGALATTSRIGYTFMGWYTAAVGGTEVTAATIVSNASNHTLYARWSADEQAIKYYANGGVGTMADTLGDTDELVSLRANSFTKAGYSFTGWNTETDGSGTSYVDEESVTMPAGGLELYAQWSADEQAIKYYANGGEGTMEDTLGDTDEQVTLRANSFTKAGYSFTGWNTETDGSGTSYVDEESVTMPAGGLELYAQWSADDFYVYYHANGGSGTLTDPNNPYSYEDDVTALSNTFSRTGYRFMRWNTQPDGSGTAYTPGNVFSMPAENVTLYAQWARSGGGGGGGGGGGEIIIPPPPPALNMEDHFAYIQGYPDNTVRPQSNITREEVAAVFYRLLEDGYRSSIKTMTTLFPDVASGRWSVYHIGTLANGDIILGYPDGTFRPGNFITRAEIATIASKFDELAPVDDDMFSDVAGHWAESYINSAAKKGWVSGYPDGTFKPNQYITRAEFVTLVNNVLERRVEKEYILPEAVTFIDLNEDAWYYEAIQEAANSHTYLRLPTDYEEWLEIYYPDLEM